MKFVTSNHHKFAEVNYIFSKNQLKVEHMELTYTELQADSIEKIAMASAASLSTLINDDFFIEDSGLIINSLKGFPGPYSSYAYQTIGCKGIIEMMKNVNDRSAHFQSVFILFRNGEFHLFEGKCYGDISFDMRGDSGFGFDPIFIPKEKNDNLRTFSEMGEDLKNSISHRSNSIKKLIIYLKEN